MRRRTFLSVGGAAVVGFGAGVGSASGDDRSTSASYAPLGAVDLPGAKELVVQDATGYVALTDGFATVDLSDPADPTVLAERRGLFEDESGGPLRQIYDVKVEGDTLVVAGPANPSGRLRGFGIYDVADPASPQLRTFEPTGTAIHNCYLDDGHLYVTGDVLEGSPLIVYDATSDDVSEVARWSPLDHDERWEDVQPFLRVLHDVYVQDGVAYCAYWDSGTWLLDVSDPTDPEYINRVGEYSREELAGVSEDELGTFYIQAPGNAHYATVSDDGTLLAVGAEGWQAEAGNENGPGGIDLYDVADPTAPEQLSTIEPTPVEDGTQDTGTYTTSHNFEIRGDRLYTSWYQDGVKLFDVGDPASPELLAHWRRPDRHSFWTAQVVSPGEYFAASSMGQRNQDDGAVMTFPDEAGTQETMPALEDTPTPSPSPSPTPSPTPTSSPTPTATESPTDEASETDAPTETSSENTPGFGAVTALGGLSLAGWRLLRDRRED
jgi:hypothetical protein